MKHLIFSVLILAATSLIAQPQAIDKSCKDYDEKIQQAQEDESEWMLPRITIKNTLNKRAIGPVKHDITIYFDETEEMLVDSIQGNEYFLKTAIIRKVVFTKSSVPYTISSTFYFDESAEIIKYIYEESYEDQCEKKEVHFKDGKAIQITRIVYVNEECRVPDTLEKRIELTKDERIFATQIIEEAKKYAMLLALHYDQIKD